MLRAGIYMLDRHLVVFAREPRLGSVKRRLAADIGAVAAWRFYREALAAALKRLNGGGRWQRWLAVTPDASLDRPGPWPYGWRRVAQGGGDLGARMTRVMTNLPPGPVVIVGTDVPDLQAKHVDEAFCVLGTRDAVIGPSADGGYWLVGLKRRPRIPAAFSNVRWSTNHALADTLTNLDGLSIATLDVLEDIDDGSALERWRRSQRSPSRRRFPLVRHGF